MTEVALRRLRAGRMVLLVDADLEAAVRAAGVLEPDGFERAFAAGGAGSGRAPTALLPLQGRAERVLLRRLRHGGLLAPLLDGLYLGLARPEAELRTTAALRAAGAPVPLPALALGRRRAGPLFECALGTVFEEDARDGLAFLEARPSRADLLRAAAAAGRAVRCFHDVGGRHPDLQIKNLLIREREDGTECLVIDLDGARRVAAVSPARRMREIMRLYRSLRKRGVLDRVGPGGVSRFFGSYCGNDRALRRALRARAPGELRRIAAHALRYPSDRGHT